jgi:mRNA interferase MazF
MGRTSRRRSLVTAEPSRGDLVWLDFDPQLGHEQAGRRPALVLSGRRYNAATGMLIACPVTTQIKGYPLEVPLPDGLQTRGVALANQVRSLDWTQRRLKVIETAPLDVVEAVLDILVALLEQD